MKLYGDQQSGNCYKVQLLLDLLQRPYEWQAVDILAGQTQTEAFLRLNPHGKIPLLVLDTGCCLSESNAILNYLAAGSAFLPEDKLLRAQILQWQFFEQYSHEPYIAVARFIKHYLGLPASRLEEFESKRQGGEKALQLMEQHLSNTDYFVGGEPSIADISLYAYTHVADQGGFDLSAYPAVNAWLARVSAWPNFLPMGGK